MTARRALGRYILDPEPRTGQTAPGVLDDVAFGGAGPSGDQPDALRQERQRSLAVGGEQSFGGEQPAQPLEAREQLAEPDLADLARAQAELAAFEIEVRAGAQHDPRALGHRVGQHRARAGDGERDVGVGVAQGQELRRRRRAGGSSWAICPSIHTSPSRAIHSPIFMRDDPDR